MKDFRGRKRQKLYTVYDGGGAVTFQDGDGDTPGLPGR